MLVIAGCAKPAAIPSAKLPLEGITLKLVVIDDPAIAKSVSQLKAEWKAYSGGDLQVTESLSTDAITAESLSADAVIYPSALLGTLMEHRQLLPVPNDILESSELAWSEVFELLQLQEATWGGETFALPLGSPVFTVMYRADVLDRLGKKPPKTWIEYQALTSQLKSETKLPIVEPLSQGWAGRVLLARAAAYAKHRDNFSSLFRIDTMEPLIAGPPFVRALEELITINKPATSAKLADPVAARREVLSGRAVMALTWASAADPSEEKFTLPEGAQIGFAELPGSDQVYNISNQRWEKRDSGEATTVPLLSIAGRLASVSQSSEYPDGAMQLIAWLSGPKWSTRVAAVSPATTLYRNSHLKSAKDWVDANLDAATAVQYGETVQQALVRTTCLSSLRISGEAEYMAALDEAVIVAIEDNAKPNEALATVAEKWKTITERLGHQRQRSAYQRSLGLNP